MNIDEYKKVAAEFGYEEEKIFIEHPEEYLNEFIQYTETSLELKIYLCELIIYRHFMPVGAILLPNDVNWFITEYFSTYKNDLVEPMRTHAIASAKDLIMLDDTFGKTTVGTVFMFAVIEFYTKYKLGFRPYKYDFFDSNKYSYVKNFRNKKSSKYLYIGQALDLLENEKFAISKSLKRINDKVIGKMTDLGLKEGRFTFYKISDRLSIARNSMMHGEQLTFFDKGKYMLMLYILFQLNEMKERKLN